MRTGFAHVWRAVTSAKPFHRTVSLEYIPRRMAVRVEEDVYHCGANPTYRSERPQCIQTTQTALNVDVDGRCSLCSLPLRRALTDLWLPALETCTRHSTVSGLVSCDLD
jgi:hypothetical protein